MLGADFFLQVLFLSGKLILKRPNLPEGRVDLLKCQGVLDGHRDLIGNELQEAHVHCVVRGPLLARKHDRAQPPASRGQRKPATALDSMRLHTLEQPRPATKFIARSQ